MILHSTTIFSSKLTLTEMSVITLHEHARAGGHVIGAGVHLYNIYVYDLQKSLNGTKVVDLFYSR